MALYGSAIANPISAARRLMGKLNSDAEGQGAALVRFRNGLTAQEWVPVLSIYELVMSANLQVPGVTVKVASFWNISGEKPKGGGRFIWDEDCEKDTADGGNTIDPENIGGFNGMPGAIKEFLNAQGTGAGLGCWVRLSQGFNIDNFGAFPLAIDTPGDELEQYESSFDQITAAIDACSKAGGGVVSGAGAYHIGNIENSILLKSNVSIVGRGHSEFRIAWGQQATGTDDYSSYVVLMSDSENVAVKNVHVDANRGDDVFDVSVTGTVQHHCIAVRGGVTQFAIQNCKTSGSKGFGAWIREYNGGNPSQGVVSGNIFEKGLNQSFAVTAGENIRIRDNKVFGNDLDIETNNSAKEKLGNIYIESTEVFGGQIRVTCDKVATTGPIEVTGCRASGGFVVNSGEVKLENCKSEKGLRIGYFSSLSIVNCELNSIYSLLTNNQTANHLSIRGGSLKGEFSGRNKSVVELKNVLNLDIDGLTIRAKNEKAQPVNGVLIFNAMNDLSAIGEHHIKNSDIQVSGNSVRLDGYTGTLGDALYSVEGSKLSGGENAIYAESNKGGSAYRVEVKGSAITGDVYVRDCSGSLKSQGNEYKTGGLTILATDAAGMSEIISQNDKCARLSEFVQMKDVVVEKMMVSGAEDVAGGLTSSVIDAYQSNVKSLLITRCLLKSGSIDAIKNGSNVAIESGSYHRFLGSNSANEKRWNGSAWV